MRVMGIDPGTVTSGYGVVERGGRGVLCLGHGIVTTSSKNPFPERLKKIYDGLHEALDKFRPDAISVETQFFAKNVETAMKLGQARGVAILAAMNFGIPVFEYSPSEIKLSVVGYGAAEKEQVLQMVRALLNLHDLPKSHDASDALAAAICHIHSSKLNSALKTLAAAPAPRSRVIR